MKYAKISTKKKRVPKMGFGDFLGGAVGGAGAGATFGPFGAIAGGLIGGVSGMMSGNARDEAQRRSEQMQQRERLQMEQQLKENYSSAILATYPTRGVEGKSFYRKGGKLAIPTSYGRDYLQSTTGRIIEAQGNKANSPVRYRSTTTIGNRQTGRDTGYHNGSYHLGEGGEMKITEGNFQNERGYFAHTAERVPSANTVTVSRNPSKEYKAENGKYFVRHPSAGQTEWSPVTDSTYKFATKRSSGSNNVSATSGGLPTITSYRSGGRMSLSSVALGKGGKMAKCDFGGNLNVPKLGNGSNDAISLNNKRVMRVAEALRQEDTSNSSPNPLINIRDAMKLTYGELPLLYTSETAHKDYNKASSLDKGRIDSMLQFKKNQVLKKAYGGKIANNAQGGQLVPIGKGAYIAKGDTHDQDTNGDGKTGITLHTPTGKEVAEVENNEVITSDGKVISDRLGFAPMAAKVIQNGGSPNGIYARQEAFKKKNGITDFKRRNGGRLPKLAWGQEESIDVENPTNNGSSPKFGTKTLNTFGNVAAALTPFIDNMANASLINKTPIIPKPVLEKPINLQTNYNINPALQNIKDTNSAYNKSIDDNTANSAVGNANKASMFADGITQANSLYAQKENTETELKNKDALNKQDTYTRNLAKLNDYNTNTMYRAGEIQERQSKNVENFVGDAKQGIIDWRNRDLDTEKMKYTTKGSSLNNSGAVFQTWDKQKEWASDPAHKAWLRNSIIGWKDNSLKANWNRDFPKEPITEF